MGVSDYHSPLLWLVKSVLRRSSPEDIREQVKAIINRRTSALAAALSKSRIHHLLLTAKYTCIDNAKYVFISALLVFKTIEWWYSETNEAQRQDDGE